MGKKQFALLYLVYLMKVATTGDIQTKLRTGNYKTLQSVLNKLAKKDLLKVQKSNNKLFYSLTEAGQIQVGYFAELVGAGNELEIARELYK